MHRIAWVMCVLGAAGCPRGPVTPAVVDGDDAATGVADPVSTGGDEAPISAADDSDRLRIDASAAEAAGLPAVAFSLSTAGTPLSALSFPGDGPYVTVSGPPGGPQLIQVYPLDGPAEAGTIEAQVRVIFADPRRGPLEVGDAGERDLMGVARPALAFVTGASMARTRWCAVAVAAPSGGVTGLLVLAGIGGVGDPDCAPALEDGSLGRVLGSLRFE